MKKYAWGKYINLITFFYKGERITIYLVIKRVKAFKSDNIVLFVHVIKIVWIGRKYKPKKR